MRKNIRTKEEQVAEKLITIVENVNLDLDRVGVHLARIAPNVSFRRLGIIIEAADYEKEAASVRTSHDPLF
jgi:hypothetical protein